MSSEIPLRQVDTRWRPAQRIAPAERGCSARCARCAGLLSTLGIPRAAGAGSRAGATARPCLGALAAGVAGRTGSRSRQVWLSTGRPTRVGLVATPSSSPGGGLSHHLMPHLGDPADDEPPSAPGDPDSLAASAAGVARCRRPPFSTCGRCGGDGVSAAGRSPDGGGGPFAGVVCCSPPSAPPRRAYGSPAQPDLACSARSALAGRLRARPAPRRHPLRRRGPDLLPPSPSRRPHDLLYASAPTRRDLAATASPSGRVNVACWLPSPGRRG